jgi:multidrug efflux pump subunit AcrA (membrane-fusion protein)
MCESTRERGTFGVQSVRSAAVSRLAHPVHGATAEDAFVMSQRRSFLGGLMLGAIVTGCGDGTRAGAPPPPPVVTVEAVVQRDVPISAEWVGSLVGYITAQIRPRVGGHLMSQNYTEGAVVKAGDLMFQVDPRPYQTALEQAEARLLQAESQLSQAKAQVSASQAQLEQAIAKVASDEAQLQKSEADQRRTQLDVNRYTHGQRGRSASKSSTTPSRTTSRTSPRCQPRAPQCRTPRPACRRRGPRSSAHRPM